MRGLIRTIDYAEQLLSESLRFLVFNLLTAPVRWCLVTASLWSMAWMACFSWLLESFGYPTHERLPPALVPQLETDQSTSGLLTRCTRTSTAQTRTVPCRNGISVIISGNDKADKAARIHLARSDSFLHVRGLKSHFSGSRNLVDTLLAFLLDIARFDLSILSKDHAGFDPEDVKLSSLWLTWHMNAGHLMSQFEVDFAKLWGGFSLHFS